MDGVPYSSEYLNEYCASDQLDVRELPTDGYTFQRQRVNNIPPLGPQAQPLVSNNPLITPPVPANPLITITLPNSTTVAVPIVSTPPNNRSIAPSSVALTPPSSYIVNINRNESNSQLSLPRNNR
eukprot:UN30939